MSNVDASSLHCTLILCRVVDFRDGTQSRWRHCTSWWRHHQPTSCHVIVIIYASHCS